MPELPAYLLITTGLVFFMVGSIGLLRLPDVYCRLHALTKADNLGLGLIGLGVALLHGSAITAVKMLLIWLLVLSASATSAHLIARHALSAGKSDAGRS